MPETLKKSASVSIFLDNINISKYVDGLIEISRKQSNMHNSISFSSISDELFNLADPEILKGYPRIVVKLNSESMFFLLETREVSGSTVTYWGRDSTARESSPWAVSTSATLQEPKTAFEVCSSLLKYSTLDWYVSNWYLPSSFEEEGSPIEIIQKIVSEIGAIVRAESNGRISVKYPYKVRPINLHKSIYDFECQNYLVMDLSQSFTFGEYYNIVRIIGSVEEDQLPILELEDLPEDEERIIGTDSYVLVHWRKPPEEYSAINTFVTAGSILEVGDSTGVYEEMVTFTDGIASVQYPIFSIESLVWVGMEGGTYSFEQFGVEIFLEEVSTLYRIAKIIYTSKYTKYRIFDHNVEQLIAAYSFDSLFDPTVKVVTNKAAFDYETKEFVDKEASDITVKYLTKQSDLVKRGEVFLDNNKYDYHTISFEYPYDQAIKDGSILWVDADRINIGNYFVKSSDIHIDGPKVINKVEAAQWLI